MAKRRYKKRGKGGTGSSVIAVLGIGGYALYNYSQALFWLLLVAGGLVLLWLLFGKMRRHINPTELEGLFDNVHLMSGQEFERFTAMLFEALGYRATLLGGSGDQGVDVILSDGSRRIAVQCKNYRKAVGNKPVQEVYAGAVHHRCSESWVLAPGGFTRGAVEIARSTRVQLFDSSGIRLLLGQARKAHESGNRKSEEATPEDVGTGPAWGRWIRKSA